MPLSLFFSRASRCPRGVRRPLDLPNHPVWALWGRAVPCWVAHGVQCCKALGGMPQWLYPSSSSSSSSFSPLGASSCPLGHGWWPHEGTSLTPVLLAPAGSEATAATRVRKPAEARTGLCGSEDTDGRDYAAESGATRSPGESRAEGWAQTWVATGARCPLVTKGLSLWVCLVKLKMVGKCPNPL